MRSRFERFRRIHLEGRYRFADLEVGQKFATSQYLWEKLDAHSALILDIIQHGSCGMLGRRRPFFPWAEVEGVQSVPLKGSACRCGRGFSRKLPDTADSGRRLDSP